MTGFRVSASAGHRLDEIYVYTRNRWGEAQAERYVQGLFEQFEAIAARRIAWRAIPAEFGVDGFVCRHERHFFYLKVFEDGVVGIVTVLHEQMHQMDRFREDLPG